MRRKQCDRASFRAEAVDQEPLTGLHEVRYSVFPLPPPCHLLLVPSVTDPHLKQERYVELCLLRPREGLRTDPVGQWEITSNSSQDKPF